MTPDHTRSTLLGNPLRALVRAMRRALWRHVGRFVTESRPRYGQGRTSTRGTLSPFSTRQSRVEPLPPAR
jgi:hypothetical protein